MCKQCCSYPSVLSLAIARNGANTDAFRGVGAIVASFVSTKCPVEGGYVGYIQKALEKDYSERMRPRDMRCCCITSAASPVRLSRTQILLITPDLPDASGTSVPGRLPE